MYYFILFINLLVYTADSDVLGSLIVRAVFVNEKVLLGFVIIVGFRAIGCDIMKSTVAGLVTNMALTRETRPVFFSLAKYICVFRQIFV